MTPRKPAKRERKPTLRETVNAVRALAFTEAIMVCEGVAFGLPRYREAAKHCANAIQRARDGK